MRIALVTESFYPAVDSSTTTLKASVDQLIDRGHEVRIIAPGPGLSSYRGCDVVRVRPLEPTGAQVRDAITAFQPDVVQAHSPRLVGRKALKHARRAGVPTVAVEQSPIHDLAADYWRAKVAARADRVLVTAPWMIGRAAELGVQAHLWEPGVDTAAFTPALRDQWLHSSWSKARAGEGRRVVVGYVGGLHRAAGVRRLAALADVANIRLVIAGAGPERDWLARRLPGARLTGALATGDLTVALPTFDVLLHPGEHETDCHTHRAAAASGVPVVAPRSGGARDVVCHLETGVLFDTGNPRDLVRAVTAVAADPHRHLLGEAGRAAAAQRSWSDAVDELVTQHLMPLVGIRHGSAPLGVPDRARA